MSHLRLGRAAAIMLQLWKVLSTFPTHLSSPNEKVCQAANVHFLAGRRRETESLTKLFEKTASDKRADKERIRKNRTKKRWCLWVQADNLEKKTTTSNPSAL